MGYDIKDLYANLAETSVKAAHTQEQLPAYAILLEQMSALGAWADRLASSLEESLHKFTIQVPQAGGCMAPQVRPLPPLYADMAERLERIRSALERVDQACSNAEL